MKKIITQSRKAVPWSEKSMTLLESYITAVTLRNYYIKHPNLEGEQAKCFVVSEADVFNSFETQKCRLCDSTDIRKEGKSEQGIKKYYCNSCHHYFLITTNTIFDSRKIPLSEWIDFLIGLFGYMSFNAIAKFNRNSYGTSRYWSHKVSYLLREYQSDIQLDGIVYIDEIYYKLIKSDIDKIEGKEKRGISNNQICIGIACNKEHVYCVVEKLGKPTIDSTFNAFGKIIKPGSKLIHDAEHSHRNLVKKLGLIDDVHKTKDLKGVPDEENPLNPININCNKVKTFLAAHKGFKREDLQGLLDIFAYIYNTPMNNLIKIDNLVKYAITKKTLLRFRDKTSNKG